MQTVTINFLYKENGNGGKYTITSSRALSYYHGDCGTDRESFSQKPKAALPDGGCRVDWKLDFYALGISSGQSGA